MGPTASEERAADDEIFLRAFADRPLTFANVPVLPEQQIDLLVLPGGNNISRPNSAFGNTPLSTTVQDLHQSVLDNVPELDEEITGAWHNVRPNNQLTGPTTTTMAELLPPPTTTPTNGPAAAAPQQQPPPHNRAYNAVTTDEEEDLDASQWIMPDLGTPTTFDDEAARRLVTAGSDVVGNSGTSLTPMPQVSPAVHHHGMYQMQAQQQWRGGGALALVLGHSGLWLAISALWAAMNIKKWGMIAQEEAVVEEPPPSPAPAPTMMETLSTMRDSLVVRVMTVAVVLAIFGAKKVTFTRADDKDAHGNPQSPPELMVDNHPPSARHASPRTAAFTSMQLTVPLPGGLFLSYNDFVQLLREFTKSHRGRRSPELSTKHANYQDLTVVELKVLARYMRIPSTSVRKAELVRRLTTNMVATLQPYNLDQLRHILVLQGDRETAAQENMSKDELIAQIVYNGF